MTNPQNSECLICGNSAHQGQDWAVPDFECVRCGQFRVSDFPGGWLQLKSGSQMVRLSGWVREQNAAGNVLTLTPDVWKRVVNMPLPRYRERALKALRVVARKYPDVSGWRSVASATGDLEIVGTSYSVDPNEVGLLFHVLSAEKLLDIRPDGTLFQLTVPGLFAVEAMSAPSSVSARGFVAMDFAENMRDAWTNGFDPAIRAAGFQPIRIDAKDYIGGITDEIISEIRQSRFVVADYTGQKSGVYFEAGFALALGLPVIPTCRADEIEMLHFDIRHLNTLLWKAPNDLADSLAKRIRAVVGVGPNMQSPL